MFTDSASLPRPTPQTQSQSQSQPQPQFSTNTINSPDPSFQDPPLQQPSPYHRATSAANGIQVRDGSVTRGRTLPAGSQSISTSSRTPSAHPTIPEDDTDASFSTDPGLQRRASNRHHRQTSVINGLQHSRNPSFNSPLTSSPLSPEALHNANLRLAQARRPAMDPNTYASPPSSSLLPGHFQSPSIDSTLNPDPTTSNIPSQGRRRTGTSRTRRGHAYGASTSSIPDSKNPGDYAMQHLFHAFVVRADQKIGQVLLNLDTIRYPIDIICGIGVDPGFDQLLKALGYITRHHPKPLVDSLMFWRQAKADAATTLRKFLKAQAAANGPPVALPRRNTEPLKAMVASDAPQASSNDDPTPELASEEYMNLDRQATVSIFLLCRGLLEVFQQSTLQSITSVLALKLEDIVFTQLRAFEPSTMYTGPSTKVSNWRIYGEVLGQMSAIDFLQVTKLYLQSLRGWQEELNSSTGTSGVRDREMRIELLLLSMQHLRVDAKTPAFHQACDFLHVLSQLFVDSHGPRVKQAYCSVFESLLTQLANDVEYTQQSPRLTDFLENVSPRVNQMLTKLRHWTYALPLSVVLLNLSPAEAFFSQWSSMCASLSTKLRDRTTRTPAMRAVCQLLWTYLKRTSDGAAVQIRKIEDLVRLVFPAGRKNHISADPSVAEASIYFIRLIGSVYPDVAVKSIVLPLIGSDILASARDTRIEQIDPERVTIGIRGFLMLLADKEDPKAFPKTYPRFHVKAAESEAVPSSPVPARAPFLEDSPLKKASAQETISTDPVDVATLDANTKSHYLQFCEILGKITILCDQAFGSAAVLSEKFSLSTPKTPLADAFNLNRKDDVSANDQRQLYYDLLHVAIQALPRCFSDHIPLHNLTNLLCTGSAHVQPAIAKAAAVSLKAIASQGYSQAVATAFPRFIFQYDSQYSTMSDEGRLGPAHIESTLTLYVDLLQIWQDHVQQKARSTPSDAKDKEQMMAERALRMEMTNVLTVVDEVEGYGLFFLCSQSRRVRSYAIKVLNIVTRFDAILGKDDQGRILRVIEDRSAKILDLKDDNLTLAERSRLQKDKRRDGNENVLIQICSSEVTYDSTLWIKAFPALVEFVFEYCPHAVALSRNIVCERLAMMQSDVERLAASTHGSRDIKLIGRSSATPVEVFFDQWKLYLIMACVTLSSPGAQSQSQLANAAHSHKASRPQHGGSEKLSSARALFSAVIPMLGAGTDALRSAVVVGLGSINRKLFRTLLESLQYAVITIDEVNARGMLHQRTPSSPSRSQMTERMRTEVTQIYKLTSTFLRHDDVLNDEWVLENVVKYTKDLRLFLSDTSVQSDHKFIRLRFHYCGLIEELYENIQRSKNATRWLPFESRKSAFSLMEDWCGYSADNLSHRRADAHIDDKRLVAAVEKEKKNLRIAALSAMASLCAGPIYVVTENRTTLSFNTSRMLSWIDTIFSTADPRMHEIGQRALRALIVSNPLELAFVEHAILCCYGLKESGALESCFNVIADIVVNYPHVHVDPIKVLGAILYTLGHDNRNIRMKSAQLLRVLDDRQQKGSNLQDFDISISDKTRAVYKAAQFEYSRRLAQIHPDLAFLVFSEFSLQFGRAPIDIKRNMVAAVLPWLQTLELQVSSESHEPTPLTNMLLVNMIEITIHSSNSLHNEIQALWQALATGPYGGNVQLILDFVIELCMDRREQNFIEFAKQIVVHLAATPAGSRVLEFFLLQLVPKNMINEKKPAMRSSSEYPAVPYLASLETVLPTGHKQGSLSLGQVSLILLVDLLVPPLVLGQDDVSKLLHAVMVLWDHYIPAVQESAKEMLVHLIHVCVRMRLGVDSFAEISGSVESLVEAVRSNDPVAIWSYEDHTGKDDFKANDDRVPAGMRHLIDRIINIFVLAFQDFAELWAKQALHWASVCPVRHLACRSFQVFRCVPSTLTMSMLGDMLARLSNTISDEQSDYQTFSLEILTTLKIVIAKQDKKEIRRYPQLLWTTVACLDTIHEREFFESLGMLDKLIDRIDFSDASSTEALTRTRPHDWVGDFTGFERLVYKGLRSADCLDRALSVLRKLAHISNNPLIGQTDRLLFTILANLPAMLSQLEGGLYESPTFDEARDLAKALELQQREGPATLLEAYAARTYSSARTFLAEITAALKLFLTPSAEAELLVFMMGLLNNQTSWFRVQILNILRNVLPLLDLRNPAIVAHGADLLSPLFRLLQTDLCDNALQVVDLIMDMPCGQMDRHQLRMSMASGPAKSLRKEYERTHSLYGIPESSGWSIPMPALLSTQTRANVHAVFYSCNDTESTNEVPAETPDIEFHVDDDYNDSYFPPQAQANGYRNFETSTETNLGDIVNTLDSLDDFFDEPVSPSTPSTQARNSGFPPYTFIEDHEANVYDQQTAPILSRTLNRTSSSLSFQHGLSDSRPSTSHYHRTQISMSSLANSQPSSFTSIEEDDGPGPEMPTSGKRAPLLPHVSTNVASRSGLHSRSITSPANQYQMSYPTSAGLSSTLSPQMSIHSPSDSHRGVDDVLSDNENSPFPNLTTSGHPTSKSISITPTSATDSTAGFMRRGVRRLTGGKSESAKEKARLRSPSTSGFGPGISNGSAQSPRIPRIPSEYLREAPVGGSPTIGGQSPNLSNPPS